MDNYRMALSELADDLESMAAVNHAEVLRGMLAEARQEIDEEEAFDMLCVVDIDLEDLL